MIMVRGLRYFNIASEISDSSRGCLGTFFIALPEMQEENETGDACWGLWLEIAPIGLSNSA